GRARRRGSSCCHPDRCDRVRGDRSRTRAWGLPPGCALRLHGDRTRGARLGASPPPIESADDLGLPSELRIFRRSRTGALLAAGAPLPLAPGSARPLAARATLPRALLAAALASGRAGAGSVAPSTSLLPATASAIAANAVGDLARTHVVVEVGEHDSRHGASEEALDGGEVLLFLGA